LGRAELADTRSFHEAGGVVRARTTAVIASRVMAPISDVHVRPGDRVARGTPLITLDVRESQANQTRASAALAAAGEAARAADLETQAAEARVALARATHERIKTLHAKRSATPQELDQAVADLTGAEAQLGSARAHAAAAGAAKDAALAAADAAAVSVSYGVLSTPFDGVVSERRVDSGSMAVPGAPLLVVEDPSALRLEVKLDEARAAGIEVGQQAEVRLDSANGAGWTPALVVERARIDPASHTFLVKVEIPGAASLRTGLFGRARFPSEPRRALTVPASALVRRGQLTFVYTVDADGLARLRPISAATLDGDKVEALAGIRDGDRVVLSPPESLTDGTRVVERQASGAGR
jgi:RND family efflux transporter MFP subunit